MPPIVDPNIARKRKILSDHISAIPEIAAGVPSFSLVEFNLTELCNRVCPFCPRVDPEVYPNRNEAISLELYEKIMADLRDIDYRGKILFSAFSEPLLHKQLDQLIKLSKQYNPKVRLESVTNGDFVTVEKLQWLFAAGLDTLLISMYDGPEQEDYFRSMREKADLRDDQVILRVRYLPPEENYGLTLSNRAGMIEMEELGVGALAEPIKEKCFYPHYQLMVDYDGSVLMCPHDWGKRLKAGNLQEQSVLEVWTSKALTFARKKLAQADRGFAPCNVCDVKGTLMGKEHFAQWQKHYGEESEAEG
jgi:radical SAM protein with 4Fe4S-binding SPASM domain